MNSTLKTSLHLCATFLLTIGLMPGASAGESVAITGTGDHRVRNNGVSDYKGTLGYDVQVGSADVQVTHLGIWDGPGNQQTPNAGEPGDGLEQPAIVGIFDVETRKLIAEATVPAGEEGDLQDEFRYVALGEPVTLPSGRVYRVVVGVDRGGNAFRDYRGGREGPAFSDHFVAGNIAYHHTDGARDRLQFPRDVRNGSPYAGPNFRYIGGGEVKAPVPQEEPGDRLADAASRAGMLVLAESFEAFDAKNLPEGWALEPADNSGELPWSIQSPGAGYSGQALNLAHARRAARTDHLAGLTYRLPQPAIRIALAFDYKLAPGQDRNPSLEVFTLGADSKPTQLRLRFNHGRIQQYGGIHIGWVNVSANQSARGNVFTTPWHRISLVIDHASEGIDLYISEPDNPNLPDSSVATIPVANSGEPIEAVRFVLTNVGSNQGMIDNLEIRTGEDIPGPGEPKQKVDLTEGYRLWTADTFPRDFTDVAYPEGIEYSIIYPRTSPWRWYHGPSIEAHNGKLYASWGANPHGENQPGELVLYNVSEDGGKTWSEARILAPGDGKDGVEYSNSHGTLLSHDGKLWGFFQHWAGGWDNPLSTEAFTLNEETGEWESQGIVATQGWPLDRPKKTADGNWLMGVSGFKMWRPAAMVSDGDNLLKWDTISIPTAGEKRRFPETSLIIDGNDVWSITRWSDRQRALVSTSNDGGHTWSEAQHSNMPMDTSKPDSGTLSTGQWFMVINIRDRNALMIAVGKPGEKGFSKLYKVRYGSPPTEHGYDGRTFPRVYCYPYSVEHDGKLYVTYSVGVADIEVAIIPVDSLKAD